MSHVDVDDLIRYRIDRALVERPDDIAAHVAACPGCASELALIDAEEQALRAGETWEDLDALLSPRNDRLKEALERRKRMDREHAHARRLLEPLLQPSVRLEEARISKKPAFLHAGVVRVLCECAQQSHEKKPVSSLEMARAAYEVARELSDDASTHPRLCMAYALREQANALRYLGRFRDALAALDAAEPLFDHDPALDPFEVGVVNLIRATVLMDKGDIREAAAIAAKARRAAREYHDKGREIAASMVEAWCLIELGESTVAARIYEGVISIAGGAADTPLLARALLNAGVAYRQMRDFAIAEERTFSALVLFDGLGLTTEIARANLQIATITVERGDLAAGVGLLEACQKELTANSMTNDAAVAGLRWAEACLALNRRAGVADKCRHLVVIFDSQEMQRRARIALSYLQEAVTSGTATPKLVAEVREYIEALPRHPERDFVPLRS